MTPFSPSVNGSSEICWAGGDAEKLVPPPGCPDDAPLVPYDVIGLRSRRPQQMAKKQARNGNVRAPKAVLRLPDLDLAKSAVLNSLSSPDAQRGYMHAIEEFVEWYCSEPRLSFSKTVVLRRAPPRY